MEISVLNVSPDGYRQYLGQRALSHPDWPTKHDSKPKARNLLPYILEPQNHPDRVLQESPDSVLIQDKFPKAQVHLLVLPKWQPHRDLHPHDAFEDPEFLAMVRREVSNGLKVAIPLLRNAMQISLKKSGMDSRRCKAILDKRDFSKDFQIGIHAHPSQHELHVHIISRDMVSWHDYGSRHYQAFNTPFLVPLESYPIPPRSEKRDVEVQNSNLMKEGFDCWRCGRHFDPGSYNALQEHLREEWQLWIRQGPDPLSLDGTGPTSQDIRDVELPETDSTEL